MNQLQIKDPSIVGGDWSKFWQTASQNYQFEIQASYHHLKRLPIRYGLLVTVTDNQPLDPKLFQNSRVFSVLLATSEINCQDLIAQLPQQEQGSWILVTGLKKGWLTMVGLLVEGGLVEYVGYVDGHVRVKSVDWLEELEQFHRQTGQQLAQMTESDLKEIPDILVSGCALGDQDFQYRIQDNQYLILEETTDYYYLNSPCRESGFFWGQSWQQLAPLVAANFNKDQLDTNVKCYYPRSGNGWVEFGKKEPNSQLNKEIPMTEILMIGAISILKKRTDPNYGLFYEYIIQHFQSPNIQIVLADLSDRLKSDQNQKIPIQQVIHEYCQTSHPVVYILDLYGLNFVSGIADYQNSLKVYDVEDTHRIELNKRLRDHCFDVCVYKYDTYFMKQHAPKTLFLEIEHYVDPTIYRDWGRVKKYDLLFYGNVLPDYYPFRYRLLGLIKKMTDLKVKIVSHPGYGTDHNCTRTEETRHDIKGEKLSQLINESKLTICTSSFYELFLRKYLECSFSHSAVIGNVPKRGGNINKYADCMIAIDHGMTDEQITKQIRYWVSHDQERRTLIEKASDRVHRHFTYEQGFTKFKSMCHQLADMNITKTKEIK